MKKSLANKLLIYFVLLNFVSIIIMGIYAYSQAKTALLYRTFDQLTSVRIEKKKRVQDFFKQRLNEVKGLKISEQFNTPFHENAYPALQNIHIYNDHFTKQFSYKNKKTHFQYNKPNEEGRFLSIELNERHQLLFDSLKKDASHDVRIIELISDSAFNSEILIYRNYFTSEDTFLFAFSLDLEQINSIMLDRNPQNGLGESGEAYLVGSDLLMRSISRFEENSLFKIKVETEGVYYAFQDSIGTSTFDDYRQVHVLSSFSKIQLQDLDWVILAEIDYEEAMIPIRSYGYNIIYIALILSMLLLGVVAILSNTITAPLRRLRKETEKISEGDYSPLEDIKADGEIKDLIQSYNHMVRKIKEQQDNLQIARDKSISSMIDGQESERSRLAMELHDGLAQTILAIKMRLENTAPEKAAKVLHESKEMFADLMHEIRSMSNDLLPAVLREFGLVKAIESLLKQMENNSQLKTTFRANLSESKLHKKAETYLYRIAQEAANNVIKHADAEHFSIALTIQDKHLVFDLIDDGTGLSKDSMHKDTNGLANIQERISVLGGIVYFYNAEPHGLNIRCKIPLKKCIDE